MCGFTFILMLAMRKLI